VASFFLGCFAFGLAFTVASFLLGAFGGGHGFHVPFLDGLLGGDGGHAAGADHHGAAQSPFNLSTSSAFLTWFGGAGYLLERYSGFAGVVIVVLSALSGLVGGGAIFVTLTRYVLPRLTEMRPEDYRVAGTVGHITSAIRAGGTGEIQYTLAGTRHSYGARSVSGEAIERGTEVVIVRVEKGLAYVERWDRYARRLDLPPGEPDPGTREIVS
jgi:membrane protein implicated in regulation of membrane protease activity